MPFWYTINPPGCNIPGTEMLRHVHGDIPATIFDKCLTLIPKASEVSGLLSIAMNSLATYLPTFRMALEI
jgi:hypothetical protein